MSGPRPIVFDLGGVVVDWQPERLIAAAAADDATRARVRSDIFAHADWLDLDRGTLEHGDAVRRFAARSGLAEPAVEALLARVAESLVPKADTLALLAELRATGHRLYFLSNMARTSFAHLERSYDFWQHFSGGVVSYRVRMLKPEAAIFEHLLREYGLRARDCVFVDDLQPNVDAAAALGFAGVRFTCAGDCARALSDILRATL
jgi:putative hydrolase of the HAD superfamily